MLVDLVVFPESVAEECLQHVMLIEASWVEAVHEVGIVQKDASRLLWELISLAVYHVDKASLFEIFDIVHDGGSAHAQLLCELADVWHAAAAGGEHVEELLYLGEVFEFYLFHKQNVHLYHHVHVLQQILAVVDFVEEEGVEAVVEIRLEVLARVDLLEYFSCYLLVVIDDFVEGVRSEL